MGAFLSGLLGGYGQTMLGEKRKAEDDARRAEDAEMEVLKAAISSGTLTPEGTQAAFERMSEIAGQKGKGKKGGIDFGALIGKFGNQSQGPTGMAAVEKKVAAQGPKVRLPEKLPLPGGVDLGAPPPPPDMPGHVWMSPDEQAAQEAKRIRTTTMAKTQAELQGKIDALVASGMTPEEAAQAVMPGSSAYRNRFRIVKGIVDGKPVYGSFDSRTGKYHDPDTGAEIPNFEPMQTGKEMPWDVYKRTQREAGVPDAEIVKNWNTRFSQTNGVRMVQQPDGSIVAVPITTSTVTGKGAPAAKQGGGAPAVPPPQRVVGGKVPPAVTKQFEVTQEAVSNYNMMKRSVDAINGVDTKGNKIAPAPPGPHDMLILSRHLAMTLGMVKGARLGKDLIEHHLKARSLPENLAVIARKVVAGDQLSPAQRAEFLKLAQDRMEEEQRKYGEIRSFYGQATSGSGGQTKKMTPEEEAAAYLKGKP